MGVIRSFKIELNPSDHQNGVYYTGEVITGWVLVDLKEEMKVRGIRLYFSGEANVKWKKNPDDSRLILKTSEKYVDQTIIIYGKAPGDKGKNSVHQVGPVRYPFQALIPENIPSTFRGKYGSIVYRMRAVIDRPWNFDETTHPLLLTIHRYVDLNKEPNAHIPQQVQGSLPFNLLCCFSGSVQVTWTTSKSGYTPGEPIVVHGQVINQTGRGIESISVKLFKTVTYHANKSNKVHSEQLAETKLSPVPEADKDFWAGNLQLQLPLTVPPFRLDHCNLIDLRYELWIKVSMSRRRHLKSKLEIAVGSVPINAPGTVADWTGASAPNWTGMTSRRWSEYGQTGGKDDSPHRWSVAGQSTTHLIHENSAPALIPSAPPPPPYSP
ncbi:arrestin domain-containing protein 17-like [Liolophura sinensis]|uniref:arrestin domain-containing protein 17-like n=1 Tax=Liolophura sinensis TaxID=3198878 RepID=UPI0031593B78